MRQGVLLLLLLGLTIAPTGCRALYSASSPVLSLDPSNLRSKLRNGPALVEFYAPWCGHCKALQPEYEKAAKAASGILTVAAVDADAHQSLASEFGIKGFPTIKFLYLDGDKVKSADYNGGRTAKDMLTFGLDKAKSLVLKRLGEKASNSGSGAGAGPKAKASGSSGGGGFYSGTDVVTLTDEGFAEEVTRGHDLWLVEFYAPWCGHCQNLKPEWIKAATELKGKVKVGAVDCTTHQATCQAHGVQGYPTIKFFNGKSKGRQEDYNGGRDAASIVAFATAKWSKYAPPPEVYELTGRGVWERACAGGAGAEPAAQLCFIAFLPDILDSKAAGRNGYLATLQKLADKFKDRPYAYLWAQGRTQPGLEANLGVGGFGYPALVALKPKDGKYSLARGAFELSHVVEFVDGLRAGTERVLAVQGTVGAIEEIQPWDGKDAVVVLEDEFTLDDLNEL